MPLIGLTGGIATGKSTAARLLADRGAKLISADEVAHGVTAPGSPVLEEIAEAFGRTYLLPDGSLDRSALGALVFSDAVARKRLEAITHPVILAEMRRRIQDARSEDPAALVVVETPLLFEAGMEGWFDAVLTVTASRETQRRRLMARSGLSRADAEARIGSQMSLKEKAARSDYVLRNDGDIVELTRQVEALLPKLIKC